MKLDASRTADRPRIRDLYAGAGHTFVMAVVFLAFGESDLLAILLVLFVPGYVLVAALFPGGLSPEKREID